MDASIWRFLKYFSIILHNLQKNIDKLLNLCYYLTVNIVKCVYGDDIGKLNSFDAHKWVSVSLILKKYERKNIMKIKRILALFLAALMLIAFASFQLFADYASCSHPSSSLYYVCLGNVGMGSVVYRHEVRCSDCGMAIDEVTCFTVTDCTRNYSCSLCGGHYTGYSSHSFGSATSVNSSYHRRACTRTGCTVTVTEAHSFTYVDSSIVNGVPMYKRLCSSCGFSEWVEAILP